MSLPWRDIMGRINIAGGSQDFTLEAKLSLPGLGTDCRRLCEAEGLAMTYPRFLDFLRLHHD
jgi:hypothetical protein